MLAETELAVVAIPLWLKASGVALATGMTMAADPANRQWWAACMPCQKPLAARKDGEWWAMMPEVFHFD